MIIRSLVWSNISESKDNYNFDHSVLICSWIRTPRPSYLCHYCWLCWTSPSAGSSLNQVWTRTHAHKQIPVERTKITCTIWTDSCTSEDHMQLAAYIQFKTDSFLFECNECNFCPKIYKWRKSMLALRFLWHFLWYFEFWLETKACRT